MLHEFITLNRNLIIARTRERVGTRPWPSVTDDELEHGVPLFLTQLSETLRLEMSGGTPYPAGAIGATAATYGGELFGAGFTVSQVVHDYGDICQAITEITIEQQVSIAFEEFQTLNRCLETAVAEATAGNAHLKFPAPAGDRRAGINL